jgi:hypothetical protein
MMTLTLAGSDSHSGQVANLIERLREKFIFWIS